MDQEVSYRQVGREKGYVPPPRLKEKDAKRQRESERDAFGNRTRRFCKLTNDTPPPGAYYRRPTLERDPSTCGSVSLKGYGAGFVSAAPRFRNVKTLQEAYLPGPGYYIGQSEVRSEGAKLASFSSSKRDCGFDVDPKRAVPGPGQYNLCSKDRHSVGSGPTSSFLCVRKPLESTEGDVNTPAPGSYELLTPAQVNVDKNGQILEHPCFRSQTSRSASFIAKSEVPGPGEYDTDRSFMGGRMGTTVSVTQGQRGKGASGSGGGGGGRFGRPLPSKEDDSTSPGPGWYTPHQTAPAEKTPSSSSMFRSATKRFEKAAVATAPGPAFYQPEHLGKKSFRWNASNQWI